QNAQGLREESLDGFRRWLDADIGSAAERADVQLEYATALFYADRLREVEDALRPIASRSDARFLLARSENQRGDTDAAVDIYMELYERYRSSGTGRQALFLAADARHEEGDLTRARQLYRQVISGYPGSDQMGLASMRLAGIEFLEENYAEAARIWDAYRTRYRSGSRALQATYWAGRARAEAGDSSGAAELFREVMRTERDGYYALLASRRLGVPFWPLPTSAMPAANAAAAATVRGWMRGIDLLHEAGFPEEASAEVDEVVARAGADRDVRYALAEALAERGYAQRAIRIGIGLGTSSPPDLRLLRILYPFPYRRLVTEEAHDRGLDPNIAAALIRQESMFEARITSHVGARGLMQIMPATGASLAEAVGIESWHAEMLYHPEINVHLGTRYLTQHMEAYDGSLPSVFSAYNAGEHRVERWKNYPEYGDDELFTERIPFSETRNYVRILTRNRALYEGLHAVEATSPAR
ncbi:MAG TPA: transglycosylase SLT domain-containing protein, partial [Thermoanaerobaculia bacterium]